MLALFTYLPVSGIVYAVSQANLSGKLIVLLLFIGSIFAWSVMVTKFRELRQARLSTQHFLTAYRKQGHPLAVYLKREKYDESPIYIVYSNTCQALGAAFEARGVDPEDLFLGGVGKETHKLSELQLSAVRNAADRTVTDRSLLLENSMGFLATATSTAPFLGLLGTVWGVMDAFGGMAAKGSAMLSAVAPGISGALLTTVVGLLVALPSAIGYNLLSDWIRRAAVEMDGFSQELISNIERHYLSQ